MQARQMVFPRFMRYSISPVLTPKRKRREKIMMSTMALRGITSLLKDRCSVAEF
jgi:hypothetical protein